MSYLSRKYKLPAFLCMISSYTGNNIITNYKNVQHIYKIGEIHMKRILALFTALAMLLVVSSGCSKKNKIVIKKDTTLQNIVDQVAEEFGDFYVQMPSKLAANTLKDLLNIDPSIVEEYAGDFAMSMTSADNFIAIKAKEGKAEEVKQALENRRAQVQKTFEQYLPGPLQVAKAGKVIVKGDYVFLIMLGNPEKGPEKDVARAEEIINSFFNE